jgi:glycogen debranching enzyme
MPPPPGAPALQYQASPRVLAGADTMTHSELRAAVRALLLRNVREGYSALLGQNYCYIAPSLKTYPFQWFWDTCFHVIMLARLGEHELAKRNLRSLFAMQIDDGFVGHMIFWRQVLPKRRSDVMQARLSLQSLRPHMSALIQPTFAAQALHTLYEETQDRVYLGEMYARVRRYHEWLATHRDWDGDGLVTIISPFESGMDWKASYDQPLGYRARRTRARLLTSRLYWKAVGVDFSNFRLRYDLERIRQRRKFLIKDAGLNAIYAVDLHCMEKLAPIVGDDPRVFAERRRRVEQSVLDLMYDERTAAFYDLRQPGAHRIPIKTSTIFFPLAMPGLDQRIAERVMELHFNREGEFRSRWPLPSLDMSDRAFFPGETPFIWRGPTWAVINWFLFHAFKRRGFLSPAQTLHRALWELVDTSGFREYYDPCTGEGHGARGFTWSGLLVDMN